MVPSQRNRSRTGQTFVNKLRTFSMDGKKRLKEKHLEAVVGAVFAESAPAPLKPESFEAPTAMEKEPEYPECGSPVNPSE